MNGNKLIISATQTKKLVRSFRDCVNANVMAITSASTTAIPMKSTTKLLNAENTAQIHRLTIAAFKIAEEMVSLKYKPAQYMAEKGLSKSWTLGTTPSFKPKAVMIDTRLELICFYLIFAKY